MPDEFAHFPFDLRMQTKDAKVRGIYLCVATDYERLMMDIIAKCEIEDVKARSDFKHKKLSWLEMGKKLQRCKDALTTYNIDYFNKYSAQFDIVKVLLGYRNMLAHGFSHYDNFKNDDTWIVYEWTKVEGNIKQLAKVTVLPFIMEMIKYRDSILELIDLVTILEKERGKDEN